MSALVEIKDVCKVYNPGENEVRALDHVNVEIEEGEFVAIIGQSGSGKSTLMNVWMFRRADYTGFTGRMYRSWMTMNFRTYGTARLVLFFRDST